MKKYLLAFAFMGFAASFCVAQTETTTITTDSATTTDSIKFTSEPQIILTKVSPAHTFPYYKTYQPFSMSANSTANMHPTVSAGPNGGVSINGGRPGNNAYFYNGVRIMDNIPVMNIPNPTFDIK